MRFTRVYHRIYSNRNLVVCKRSHSTAADKQWQSVVGLEVHAQLSSESKLFSGAENTFGGLVNNCVSLFDAAIPGTLPVLNRKCVELGLMTALALSCKINEVSTFDRKHYFYADLPSGYQITQQRAPLASDGVINFQVFTPGVHKKPYKKSSKIKQIQLEQDSGKSLHDFELKRSLVDLNRAGAPLIELVFEPDLEDGEEAAALVKELVLIVQRLGACSGRMEEGALRVDANVSLRRPGAPLSTRTESALVKELVLIVQRLGACSGRMEEGALRVDANVSLRRPGAPLSTRTEIKNIGSVRGVAVAIRHEIERQRGILDAGGTIVNQTRAWDAVNKVTVAMRDKEVVQDYRYRGILDTGGTIVNQTRAWDAVNKVTVAMRDKEVVQDYRFMPEPNLPPLRVNLRSKEDARDVISVPLIQDRIPELPEETRKRLTEDFQLRPETTVQLVNEPVLLEYFKELTTNARNPNKVANLLLNDLLTVLNKNKLDVEDCPITNKQMSELVDLLFNKEINLDVFRKVLDALVVDADNDLSPSDLIKKEGWALVTDSENISKLCKDIIENNPKLVKQYRDGKTKVFKALLGMLAKNSQNKIDMAQATKILEDLLKK